MNKSLEIALQAVAEAAERASQDLIRAACREAPPLEPPASDLGVIIPELSPIGTTPENTPKYTAFFTNGRASQYSWQAPPPPGSRLLDTCPPFANRRVVAYHAIYEKKNDEKLVKAAGYDNPQRTAGLIDVYLRFSTITIADNDEFMRDTGYNRVYQCEKTCTAEVDNYLNLFFPASGLYIILNMVELPAAALVFMADIVPASGSNRRIFRQRHLMGMGLTALENLGTINDRRGVTLNSIWHQMIPHDWREVFDRATCLAAAIMPLPQPIQIVGDNESAEAFAQVRRELDAARQKAEALTIQLKDLERRHPGRSALATLAASASRVTEI